MNDRAGAHGAGFEGDVKGGACETVVAEEARGLAEDNNFGVGSGVVVTEGAVAGACEDGVILDEHCADGDFAGLGGDTGFGKRDLHEVEVVRHPSARE